MTSSWWFYRQFAMPETSENWPGLVDSCVYYAHQTRDPANWRSRRVTECCACARNIVSAHKINFCVDMRMVCFPCVWLCFICVSFEFTLGSCVFNLSLRCYWARGKLKIVSNQHIVNRKISWRHASTNLLRKFTRYCLTQWISRLQGSFEIHWVRQ